MKNNDNNNNASTLSADTFVLREAWMEHQEDIAGRDLDQDMLKATFALEGAIMNLDTSDM